MDFEYHAYNTHAILVIHSVAKANQAYHSIRRRCRGSRVLQHCWGRKAEMDPHEQVHRSADATAGMGRASSDFATRLDGMEIEHRRAMDRSQGRLELPEEYEFPSMKYGSRVKSARLFCCGHGLPCEKLCWSKVS